MKENYQKFWDWVVKNKTLFEEDEIASQSVELIDEQIISLGDFAWEIGPGINKPFSLTISPSGDRKLIEITKEIVSQAPVLDTWEFYYAKPVKEWDNYFDVLINEEEIGVDISNWKYVLFRSDDDYYDIQIKPQNMPPSLLMADENELYGIVEMVLESIIGEEMRIERINELEVVGDIEDSFEKDGSLIINLKKHLESIK